MVVQNSRSLTSSARSEWNNREWDIPFAFVPTTMVGGNVTFASTHQLFQRAGRYSAHFCATAGLCAVSRQSKIGLSTSNSKQDGGCIVGM